MKPDVLDGYSSSLYLLAREVQHQKIGAVKPRFVIGGAELVDAGSRHFVEDVFWGAVL
jgi:phenylacetate-coenzyme A ligase PaaK-like adenylate-forming protein